MFCSNVLSLPCSYTALCVKKDLEHKYVIVIVIVLPPTGGILPLINNISSQTIHFSIHISYIIVISCRTILS